MGELPDQSGDVGNNRVLQQGEATHDGCTPGERGRVKTRTRSFNTTEERGLHLS